MNNNYAIQIKATGKWIKLDANIMPTPDITYTSSFLDARWFNDIDEAQRFLSYHRIKKDDCELFKLNVYAQPLK